MILESCRRAAPRGANAGARMALGVAGCLCLLATGSIAAEAEAPPELPLRHAPAAESAPAVAPERPVTESSTDELQPAPVPPTASGAGGGARDELRAPADPIDFGLGAGVTTWLAGPATGRRGPALLTRLSALTGGRRRPPPAPLGLG
jgi:hypothetical protein